MRMRRKLALLTALLLSGAALAQTPPKLLVWINGDKAYNGLQQVGNAFEKASRASRSWSSIRSMRPRSSTQAAGAGKGPDIFCWPHDRIGEWAKAGLLTAIRPGKKLREENEEAAWKAMAYRGKLWSYPIAIETTGLIYNKALVPKPPATMEELIALDKQLQSARQARHLVGLQQELLQLAAAGRPGRPRLRVVMRRASTTPSRSSVNNEGALAGAKMLERLVKEGHMPKGARYSEMETGFARGTVAMMISGPWAWDNARRAKIDFGVAAIPAAVAGPALQALCRRAGLHGLGTEQATRTSRSSSSRTT